MDTLLELYLRIAQSSENGSPLGSLTVLRVLRVARVVRVFRVIRVMRFFKELRMMIFSTINCLKSLLWVAVVLGILFYIFGVAFVSGTTNFLETSAMYQDPENKDLRDFFGELGIAALSLFFVMTGGQDWGDYYTAIARSGAVYAFLFLFYIALTFFALVNIVTGVFVDSAISIGSRSLDIAVAEEIETKKDHLASLKMLFQELHKDDDALHLTAREFEQSLKNESVIAFFRILKLDVGQAGSLFQLLDVDDSGTVDLDEFINGCYELKGHASLFDQKVMQTEINLMKETLNSMARRFH
jgi:hypothetical protein